MTCSTHFQVDHMISYLPLSHIAAQMMDIHAQLSTGLTIHFAQPDALKGSLKDTLKACHVTQSSLDSTYTCICIVCMVVVSFWTLVAFGCHVMQSSLCHFLFFSCNVF